MSSAEKQRRKNVRPTRRQPESNDRPTKTDSESVEKTVKMWLLKDPPHLCVKKVNYMNGKGLFTKIPIQRGDFVINYRGKLVQNYVRTEEDTYLFHYRSGGKLVGCVDASEPDSGFGRFINDVDARRKANCKPSVMTIDGKPTIAIFATTDIAAG